MLLNCLVGTGDLMTEITRLDDRDLPLLFLQHGKQTVREPGRWLSKQRLGLPNLPTVVPIRPQCREAQTPRASKAQREFRLCKVLQLPRERRATLRMD